MFRGKGVDVVIPLGAQSRWGNSELKYMLRSMEKYLSNYKHVYIVGECPDWVKNVKYVFMPDQLTKTQNIMEKLRVACNIPELSEDFLYTQDDLFLLMKESADIYPNYMSNKKMSKIISEETGTYQQLLVD